MFIEQEIKEIPELLIDDNIKKDRNFLMLGFFGAIKERFLQD